MRNAERILPALGIETAVRSILRALFNRFGWQALFASASFFGTSHGIWAQEKGEVRMAIQPHKEFQYILDGKERLNNPGVMLDPGLHRFVIWAPNRSIVDTTIMVQADSVIILRKVLPVAPAYRAHVKALQRNGYKRTGLKAAPIILTGAASYLAIVANKQRRQADEALRSAEDRYQTERIPTAIDGLKYDEIPARQQELDAAHRRTMVWTSVAVVGAAATVAGFVKAARIKNPEYEDREKIRFDGMAWATPDGIGLFASLQIPLR